MRMLHHLKYTEDAVNKRCSEGSHIGVQLFLMTRLQVAQSGHPPCTCHSPFQVKKPHRCFMPFFLITNDPLLVHPGNLLHSRAPYLCSFFTPLSRGYMGMNNVICACHQVKHVTQLSVFVHFSVRHHHLRFSNQRTDTQTSFSLITNHFQPQEPPY